MEVGASSSGAHGGGEAAVASGRVRFGDFVFDIDSGELWRGGAEVDLQPQPGRLLALLIERRGRPVSREEIQAHLWGDLAVEAEAGVNFAIRRVRAALGEDASDPRYIETLVRRGYRFQGEVEAVEETRRPGRPGRLPVLASVGLAALVLVAVWAGWARLGSTDAPASPLAADSAERGEVRREPRDSPARDAYLRARYLLSRGEAEALARAASLFREALRADPEYAPAYVGLEEAARAELGEDERARLLETALRWDSRSAEAYAALGWLELENRQRPAAARDAAEAALAIDPSLASAVHASALAYAALGQEEEALARIRRGMELDPAGAVVRGDAFLIYFWTRRPVQAVAELERALELEPSYGDLRWEAAFYLAQAGRWRQCAEQLRVLLAAPETRPVAQADLEAAHWQNEAKRLYRKAVESFSASPRPPAGPLAQASLVLGEDQVALDWLEAALDQDWYGLTYLGVDPSWDPIRRQPRFQALLDRLGLSEP